MPLKIEKSDRTELKGYFVRNAIPSEANFAALIDAPLNQKDDGLAKAVNNPLSVEAGSAAAADKTVLSLYESFADRAPAWNLSLKSAKESGLCISGGAEPKTPRLFIDAATGNLGVGTAKPSDSVDISGGLRILTDSNPIRFTSEWSNFGNTSGPRNQAEISNDVKSYKTLMIVGNRSNGGVRRVSIWDRLEVNGTLAVTVQEAWIVAKPAPGWAHYGGVYGSTSYFKDSLGRVHLRGLIRRPGNVSDVNTATTLFTLPAGYRPTTRQLFACQTHPNAAGRLDVESNGNVALLDGHSNWVSVNGLSFSTH